MAGAGAIFDRGGQGRPIANLVGRANPEWVDLYPTHRLTWQRWTQFPLE